jgi:hypothetical protein
MIVAYIIPVNHSLVQQQEAKWNAEPLNIAQLATPYSFNGYTPSQIKIAYNLPFFGGNGTTIAIINAYDTPDILSYFNTFSAQFNLPDNSTGCLIVHKMTGTNSPPQSQIGWQLETCLDVEWAHAIAPNATILLVEAKSPIETDLIAAIDYATNQKGVVAVSMSWGGEEFSWETIYENHFNKPGITFFAASGDDGSYVSWPAVSANVVSVGGTTLNLNTNGTVISEVAWHNSSGGISSYITLPSYQVNFGLRQNFSMRTVPDVSYNGDVSTGVAVFKGAWYVVGGTSAGAPQWAAIHALGLSATNLELYARAKVAYSSYFRDIVNGSNYVNQAGSGYDLVTGLGSPITFNFGVTLDLSPIAGGVGTAIALTGTGLTGSSANISYLNPVTKAWVSIINNTAVITGNLTYKTNAPDLMQTNQAGDTNSVYDNIIFRIVDNNNSRSYNTSKPFMEYRRGLTKVGNSMANGIYGNNTDLTGNVFVKKADILIINGLWFYPGNSTLLWDDTNIGNGTIDQTGSFNTNITVPASIIGHHKLTIQDLSTIINVNITYAPTLTDDYTEIWHTNDFNVNIATDSPVNETFYRLNGRDTQNLTTNGLPIFTTEGTNNTLEYWCSWSPDGTTLLLTTHTNITEIKLDKSPPSGSITTNSLIDTPNLIIYLNATDNISDVSSMRFSNDGINWSSWEPYNDTKTWILSSDDGLKNIYAECVNGAGLVSTFSCGVTLITSTISPQASAQPVATSTPSPTVTTINTPSPTGTSDPSPTAVPELPFGLAVLFFAVATLIMLLLGRKQINTQPKFSKKVNNRSKAQQVSIFQ